MPPVKPPAGAPPPPTAERARDTASSQFDLFSCPRPRPGACPGPRVLSVSELTRELKGLLEPRFAQVSVRGEISNLRPAQSGHHYFTLKDQGACIAVVLFRADAARLKFRLQDGLAVVCRGRLSVYEARGQYQILCDAVEPEGAGALALAFEQLKSRLAQEGLFDPARKKKVPFLPRRIGIVTSPSGAALHDFLRVLHDRFPIPVLLVPVRVQGEGASLEIARGIGRLAATGVDVIVVTRGGGSIEDLWAFNEEPVARAIAASAVPVVSAIGHEVDFTIADFVADRRCATPTDAAKTLAPVRAELLRSLDQRRRHLRQSVLRLVAHQRERLRARGHRLADPRRRIADERLALDHVSERAQRGLARALSGRRSRLDALAERLLREHPRSRLARGPRALVGLSQALGTGQSSRLARERAALAALARRLNAASPGPNVAREHRSLGLLRERAERALARRLADQRVRLSRATTGLDSLSPVAVLARGYAIAFDESRRVLRSAAEARSGSALFVLLSDRSELEAKVVGPVAPASLGRSSGPDRPPGEGVE
ncbi:MAG: exodeoxyribonuclease VII large subunit [Deltaproteobacteria bacterium]|nr:exodeoxyribonuclease VII large subunit [Deltaproteobacteria bacterium]